jgi:hypothetical protein
MLCWDVGAVHANTVPLDLERLFRAPPEDLMADVFGIRRFVSREDASLRGDFLPRFRKET